MAVVAGEGPKLVGGVVAGGEMTIVAKTAIGQK